MCLDGEFARLQTKRHEQREKQYTNGKGSPVDQTEKLAHRSTTRALMLPPVGECPRGMSSKDDSLGTP